MLYGGPLPPLVGTLLDANVVLDRNRLASRGDRVRCTDGQRQRHNTTPMGGELGRRRHER